jgi:hypothetical protein
MSILSTRFAKATVAVLAIAAGCRDQTPTAPVAATPTDPASQAVARCDVSIAARTMTCVAITNQRSMLANRLASSSMSANADRLLGGQDVYIKLTSTNNSFDNGTGIFSTDVTVQNLARVSMGTTDGVAALGVKVFFQQIPTVTSGSGTVTIDNADSSGTFVTTNQPYFAYAQILHPYEISNSKPLHFAVSAGVGTFSFVVYVDAPMTDETGTLLDRVWTGTTDTDWLTATNWRDGSAPDATSTVAIPTDSLLAPGHHSPTLAGNSTLANLRVGSGNTVDLGGHVLSVAGNVDALGVISNGVVDIMGPSAVIGGAFGGLQVSGAARTQRTITTSAAVSIPGTLTVADQSFVIRIP